MPVEKIDKNEDILIDPNLEIRTITYTVKELRASGMVGIIAQHQIVKYFEAENPELIAKRVYSFKMNPQDQALTIKMQVTKRRPNPTAEVEILDEFATPKDEVYLKTMGGLNARIAELEKENLQVRTDCINTYLKATELNTENLRLKSAIEKFGNGNDFDWNVLARIDELEQENAELKKAGEQKTDEHTVECQCKFCIEEDKVN